MHKPQSLHLSGHISHSAKAASAMTKNRKLNEPQ